VIEDLNPEDRLGEKAESDTTAAQVPFPSEPFACPNCGQMLGPGCRVCAACKTPVDPARINIPALVVEPAAVERAPAPPERVRFPWTLFLILLLARFIVAATVNGILGLTRTFLILGSLELLCGAWVYYDANRRRCCGWCSSRGISLAARLRARCALSSKPKPAPSPECCSSR
jgi:hypothetical protein